MYLKVTAKAHFTTFRAKLKTFSIYKRFFRHSTKNATVWNLRRHVQSLLNLFLAKKAYQDWYAIFGIFHASLIKGFSSLLCLDGRRGGKKIITVCNLQFAKFSVWHTATKCGFLFKIPKNLRRSTASLLAPFLDPSTEDLLLRHF